MYNILHIKFHLTLLLSENSLKESLNIKYIHFYFHYLTNYLSVIIRILISLISLTNLVCFSRCRSKPVTVRRSFAMIFYSLPLIKVHYLIFLHWNSKYSEK